MSNAYDYNDDQPPPQEQPPPPRPSPPLGLISALQNLASRFGPTPAAAATEPPSPPQAGAAPPSAQEQVPPPSRPPPPAAAPFPPSPAAPEALQQQWQLPQRTDFQAFVPNSPKGFEHWSRPRWAEGAVDNYPDVVRTSLMPSPREGYGVIRGAGSQLGQFSSPAVSGPAMIAGNIAKLLGPFLDYVGGGKFTPAFNRMESQSLAKQRFALQAQREYFEMERERMMDASDQAVRQFRQNIEPAREIFEEYRDDVIDLPTAENRLRDWAINNGHDKLRAALDNGGLRAAENWLSHEAAKVDDLAAGSRTLRASDARRRQTAAGGGTPVEGSDLVEGGDAGEPRTAGGQRILPGRERQAPERPAAPAAPEPETPDEMDEKIRRDHDLTKQGMDYARSFVETGTVDGQTANQLAQQLRKDPRHPMERIHAAETDLRKAMNRAVAAGQNPAQKLFNLQRVSPNAAATVRQLGTYQTPASDIKIGTRSDMERLTASVYPDYSSGKFKFAQEYSNPRGTVNQIMTKVTELTQATSNVYRILDRMPEGRNIPATKIAQWIANDFTGDDEYQALSAALQQVSMGVAGVTQLTGQARMTPFRALMERMHSGGSPRQIRSALKTEAIDAWSVVAGYQNQWNGQFNKETLIPGMDPGSWKTMSAILRGNEFTGQFPDDAPQQLKAYSKDPKAASPRLTADQKEPPLTTTQAQEAQRRINRLERSADPLDQERARYLSRRLGVTKDPPWEERWMVLPELQVEAPNAPTQ